MKIRLIRGQKVVTDSDFAEAIGVPTKQLLTMFRRHEAAFLDGSCFVLTPEEQRDLLDNYCSTHAERLRYAKRLPTVFAAPAILMLLSMQRPANGAAKRYRDNLLRAINALSPDVFDPEKILESN